VILFLPVIFIGLLIRLFLVGNTGFLADIAFWKSWSLAAVDHGIVWTAHNTNINYPPGFIYVLWLMGKIYSFFGNPHDYINYWRENNFGFLLVSKSFAIVADIGIACLIYWFFSQKKKLEELGANISTFLPPLLSAVFFLNPVVIIDSALWGQVESLGILFTIVAVILLFYRRPLLGSAVFTVGALMKLQNIIFIPLFFLFIFRYFDLKTFVKSLAAAAIAFFAVCFPFFLARDMDRVLYLMTLNNDYFPWLSLNAHNLWWIVSGASGMKVIDKILITGVLNAKTVGLIIFSGFYLLFCLLILLKPKARNFFLSLSLAILAFFLFTTQSHERYSYPVVVLLLFFYPFLETMGISRNSMKFSKNTLGLNAGDSREGFPNEASLGITNRNLVPERLALEAKFGKPERQDPQIITLTRTELYFWFVYAALTAAAFFNIHTGLIINYPQSGIYTLAKIATPAMTIVNSYAFIVIFFLLLPFIFWQIPYTVGVIPLIFMASATFLGNFPYLVNGKVSLTQFKPIIMQQDYGTLQVNRSVNSSTGWKSWSRLSDDYFFYRKGFGTHANSTIVFDIGKKFKKFSSDFGVDTEAQTQASVIFKVIGDGKELFQSKKMGRFDFPGHLEIDISGVRQLGLVVNDAGDGINSDHADWLNPILYR
jgi:Gpi18-like mannosyltransferase